MKKSYLYILISLIILMVGTSCAYRRPFYPEYWFQALGQEGEFVMTADISRLKEGEGKEIVDQSLFDNPIASKSERISLSLIPQENDSYPLPLSSFVVGGAVEGKFSTLVVNTSLKFSGYMKTKENGIVRYKGDGMSVYAPLKNLILFTDGDYDDLYDRTISSREKVIEDSVAEAMATSLFSLYVFEPETLMDIGFEIPQVVLDEMEKTCILFDERGGELVMTGIIETTGDGTARALSTLLKNQVVQEKRRNGETLDTKLLSTYFSVEDNVVKIIGYPLSSAMKEKARGLMSSGIGGLF